MWKRIGQDRPCIPIDIHFPKNEIDQRDSQKDQAGNGEEKMRCSVEIAQPLRERKPGGKQRVLEAQDLRHAAGPADALANMSGETLSGESGGQRNIQERSIPTVALHAERRMRIFRHRLHSDAADLIERTAAQNGARPAEECCIPEVISILYEPMEEIPLIWHSAELPEVPLKRVGRIELMRCL